jgi:hypothetical protein
MTDEEFHALPIGKAFFGFRNLERAMGLHHHEEAERHRRGLPQSSGLKDLREKRDAAERTLRQEIEKFL